MGVLLFFLSLPWNGQIPNDDRKNWQCVLFISKWHFIVKHWCLVGNQSKISLLYKNELWGIFVEALLDMYLVWSFGKKIYIFLKNPLIWYHWFEHFFIWRRESCTEDKLTCNFNNYVLFLRTFILTTRSTSMWFSVRFPPKKSLIRN